MTTTHPDTFDFFRLLEMGASDFLLPPLRRSELLPRLIRQARVTCRSDALVQKLKEDIGLKQIIGENPAFLDKVRCEPRFARCDATVLISGESGTGKEIFARAIHYLSPRADRPFVPVNCGALPENLVESEIFAHKRGAFTGAASDQAGLIREAEGGTLFLDEIDTLTPQAQVKLLRFFQDGEYRSVGSQQILHANIRVIAAANADFSHLVRSGKFREDLFYRPNVLALALPALRERPCSNRALADTICSNGYEDVRADDVSIRISGTTNYPPQFFDTVAAQTPAPIHASFKVPSKYLDELKFSESLPRDVAEEMMKDRLLSTARLSSILRTNTKMISV